MNAVHGEKRPLCPIVVSEVLENFFAVTNDTRPSLKVRHAQRLAPASNHNSRRGESTISIPSQFIAGSTSGDNRLGHHPPSSPDVG